MSNVFTRPVPQTDADYEAEATRILADIDALFERMDASRAESERLTGEIKTISTRTEAKLVDLEAVIRSLSKVR